MRRQLGDELHREALFLVPPLGVGGDLGARELADALPQEAVVLGQLEVHGQRGTMSRPRQPCKGGRTVLLGDATERALLAIHAAVVGRALVARGARAGAVLRRRRSHAGAGGAIRAVRAAGAQVDRALLLLGLVGGVADGALGEGARPRGRRTRRRGCRRRSRRSRRTRDRPGRGRRRAPRWSRRWPGRRERRRKAASASRSSREDDGRDGDVVAHELVTAVEGDGAHVIAHGCASRVRPRRARCRRSCASSSSSAMSAPQSDVAWRHDDRAPAGALDGGRHVVADEDADIREIERAGDLGPLGRAPGIGRRGSQMQRRAVSTTSAASSAPAQWPLPPTSSRTTAGSAPGSRTPRSGEATSTDGGAATSEGAGAGEHATNATASRKRSASFMAAGGLRWACRSRRAGNAGSREGSGCPGRKRGCPGTV